MSNTPGADEVKRKPQSEVQQDAGKKSEVKQDAGKKPAPENPREQGQTANIRQNTQNRQQNR